MAAAGDAQQDAKAPPVNRFPVTFVQQNLWREVPDARQQQGDKSAPKKRGGGGVKIRKKKGARMAHSGVPQNVCVTAPDPMLSLANPKSVRRMWPAMV